MEITKRRSRWTKDDIRDKNGKPKRVTVTDNDIAILKLLAPTFDRAPWGYRFLRSNYIYKLLGREKYTILERLDLLSTKSNNYLGLPDQPRNNFRAIVYELGDAGSRELKAAGLDLPKRKDTSIDRFRHELLRCDIAASFEIATQEHAEIKILPWPAIKGDHTHGGIPISRTDTIFPDWHPFAIERQESPRYTFIVGFEADCMTMPLETNDTKRSSIQKKFLDYLRVLHNDTIKSHFGFNTKFFPFVTLDTDHMNAMMELLTKIIARERLNPVFARSFGFKVMPSFYATPAPATGHMITEPWSRAGFPPFSLLTGK